MGNGSNILYRIHMLRRFVALLVVLCVSFSAFASSYDNAEAILVSDIPITYGDQSFRERILERTRGERDPIGLVLTGGSARALAHLGVLSYLEDEGIVPDFIVSNSMGSIIGLLYAAGLSPDQIIEALTAGDLSSLFTFTLPVEGGLLHPSGLETLVKSVVGTDLRLEDLDIPVMVVCDDLVTKREVRICEGDFTEVLLASFALPVYFAPRIYNGHLLIDGGVISLAPVDAAFEYSDTVIVSTTFYNVSSIDLRNIISILNSSFDIGKNQKAAADMKAHEDFIWIRCDVEQFSFMDFDKMGEMAGIGYESAAEKADELARFVWDRRHEFHYTGLTQEPDEALETALSCARGTAFLTDSGDNVTSGAVGANTGVLRQVLASPMAKGKKILFGGITDSTAAARIASAEIGDRLRLSLGEQIDELSNPVDLEVTVRGRGRLEGFLGYVGDYGEGEVVSIDGLTDRSIDVIVLPFGHTMVELHQFEALGVSCADYDLIVVKQGYIFPELKQLAADSGALAVMSLTEGATYQNTAKLPLKRIMRPMFPIDDI